VERRPLPAAGISQALAAEAAAAPKERVIGASSPTANRQPVIDIFTDIHR
jgi:hypothetical protein